MTARRRLAWYTIAVLSIILTLSAISRYGEIVLEADRTGLSAAIVLAYLVMTVWLGVAIHRKRGPERALYWAKYLVGLLPALGLIGTVIGISLLFGLADGETDKATLAALGTALYTTLAGLIYSEALWLQWKVCGGDA